MTLRTILSLAAAGILAATAAPFGAAARSPDEAAAKSDAKPRQCFSTSRINNFASDDPRILNVRVGMKDIYQFEMMGRCHEIDWNNKIAVRSRAGSYICTGLDAEVISPTAIGPQTCPVTRIRKLTEAEIAALPKRARP
jgi:polynucleotide 5'-kinase involved in rRNA processing